MLEIGVHAATDISGYGLVGHLLEMCGGSGVGADIDANAVPLFDEVVALANAGHVPGGTLSNYRFALTRGVRFADALSEPIRFALCDAQTSGGLLISAGERQAEALLAALRRADAGDAAIVGTISTGQEIVIR
jgi:selenide,water dikinase